MKYVFELDSKTRYLLISKWNYAFASLRNIYNNKNFFYKDMLSKKFVYIHILWSFYVFKYVISISCANVILLYSFNWTSNIKYFVHYIAEVVMLMNFFLQILIVIVFKYLKWATLVLCAFSSAANVLKNLRIFALFWGSIEWGPKWRQK